MLHELNPQSTNNEKPIVPTKMGMFCLKDLRKTQTPTLH